MMINERPYTNENGFIDDGLITEHKEEEIRAVSDWIMSNIIPADSVLYGYTSYGIKHILQHDTGIYLTNNEFKDAMLLAGFTPVNPRELNWRYRIKLTRFINDNPSPFFRWAEKFKDEALPCGDFVRDMLRDFDFPKEADFDAIESYLMRIDACDGAMRAFKVLWKAYQRQFKGASHA